jgi:hypothetical protein
MGRKDLAEARRMVNEFKNCGGQSLKIGAAAALFRRLLPLAVSRSTR